MLPAVPMSELFIRRIFCTWSDFFMPSDFFCILRIFSFEVFNVAVGRSSFPPVLTMGGDLDWYLVPLRLPLFFLKMRFSPFARDAENSW